MINPLTVNLVSIVLMSLPFLFPSSNPHGSKIGMQDFPIKPLTLPTPKKFGSKEDLVAFTRSKSDLSNIEPGVPKVEEYKIGAVKVVVMEYRQRLLTGYFIYRDFSGELVRIVETNFFPERLFFSANEKGLVIKKGLNAPEIDVMEILNFDNEYKINLNYKVKNK